MVLTPSAITVPRAMQFAQQLVSVGIYIIKCVPVLLSIPNESFLFAPEIHNIIRINIVAKAYPTMLKIVLQ